MREQRSTTPALMLINVKIRDELCAGGFARRKRIRKPLKDARLFADLKRRGSYSYAGSCFLCNNIPVTILAFNSADATLEMARLAGAGFSAPGDS